MQDSVTFFRDQFGTVAAKSQTGYFIDLCSQLTSDIQTYAPDAIDLIVLIDGVETGRSDLEEWEGNSYVLRAHRHGVTLESLGPEGGSTTYTFGEAKAVILEYFRYLAPDPDTQERHVRKWEQDSGRSFTNRSLLGLS